MTFRPNETTAVGHRDKGRFHPGDLSLALLSCQREGAMSVSADNATAEAPLVNALGCKPSGWIGLRLLEGKMIPMGRG